MEGKSSVDRIVFLDLNVLDDMHRIDTARYTGDSAPALRKLRQMATCGDLEIWMARISKAEMAIGLGNPNLTPDKRSEASHNDEAKSAIASSMHVQWLTYPASTNNDQYSLANITMETAGPNWRQAKDLETKLKQQDIRKGDEKQVVSCIYGRPETGGQSPDIRRFVSEDNQLRKALNRAQQTMSEIAMLQISSVREFMQEISKLT